MPSSGVSRGAGKTFTPRGQPYPTRATSGTVSPGMIDLLRKIVKDPDFRTQFAADPVLSATTARLPITTAEITKLQALGPERLEIMAQAVCSMAQKEWLAEEGT